MPASPASVCRIDIGDIEITFVPDGSIHSRPTSEFPGSTDDLWQANDHLLDADGLLVMSLGVLLVRTAGRQVLVDLGWGPGGQDLSIKSGGVNPGRITGGDLLVNLAALGVQPEDIDAVLISHLHRDHTGWIVDPSSGEGGEEGKESGAGGDPRAMFPNAVHHLSQVEWDHWSAEVAEGRGEGGPTVEQLAVLGTRMSPVVDGDHPVPGIDIWATPGHTPGHLGFVISSGTERAIVLGDAVHCPIEISEPELRFSSDVDAELAARTRLHIEQELTDPDTITAGPHFPDLVFGRLMPGSGRPTWQFPETQLR